MTFFCLMVAVMMAETALLQGTTVDIQNAILVMSGVSAVEELSEEIFENYRRFASSPLDLNSASYSHLKSSGLLTEEQVLSFIEARSRSGDVLSWTELSLLDGFSEMITSALRYFAVLKSSRAPGERETLYPCHELLIRGMVKTSEDEYYVAGGLKYGLNLGDRMGVNWSTRTTYNDSRIDVGTISAAWYGKRYIGKIVAGDMALRFGQGLAVWTGFSLSGLSSIQSYRRNPTGISQTSSFNSERKGLGIDFNLYGGSSSPVLYSISAAYSVSDNLPVFNISRSGRRSTLGVTLTSSTVSVDFKTGFPSLSVFGEGCLNFRGSDSSTLLSAVAGVIWSPEYGTKIGAVARFAENILQPAAGYESTVVKINFEGKADYTKRKEMYKLTLATGDSLALNMIRYDNIKFMPSARISGKFRPQENFPFRADLRMDLDLAMSGLTRADVWTAHLRSDFEYSKDFSWHSYLEAGYHGQAVSSYFRTGIFHVDNWDDRIYVYERDLPGSFTCPALYGRGMNASFIAALKIGNRRIRHVISIKASMTRYFNDKPSVSEFKVQYSLKV